MAQRLPSVLPANPGKAQSCVFGNTGANFPLLPSGTQLWHLQGFMDGEVPLSLQFFSSM